MELAIAMIDKCLASSTANHFIRFPYIAFFDDNVSLLLISCWTSSMFIRPIHHARKYERGLEPYGDKAVMYFTYQRFRRKIEQTKYISTCTSMMSRDLIRWQAVKSRHSLVYHWCGMVTLACGVRLFIYHIWCQLGIPQIEYKWLTS